jgi:branched-subunit amino acid transport protein
VSLPAWTTLAAAAFFILVSLWWLLVDGRLSIADAGAHQYAAITYRDGFGNGHPFLWFTAHNPPTYPPLVHLVGAAATAVGGISTTTMVMGQNLVFIPALVAGCYGSGTILYDRRVGALAAVFGLATPMIVTQFHIFLLDAPQAAMVALSVWLILASRRFSNDLMSVLAGLATGGALMTKNTSAFFLAGLLAVALLRGGWRNWRGMVLFAVGALVVAGAWYGVHLRDLLKYAGGAAVAGSSDLQYDPPAFSFDDLTAYFWYAVNYQQYLPLMVLAIIGLVPAIRRILPRPGRDDQMPEFLAGCFVGWLLTDLLANNDPRYALPTVVFLAVLGTGWTISISARAWRRVAMGVVGAICAVTFASSAFGIGPTLRIDLGANPPTTDQQIGRLTFLNPEGFIVGAPEGGGHFVDVLKRAHQEGARLVALDRNSATVPFFDVPGLSVALREAGLSYTPAAEYTALGPKDIFIIRADPGTVDAPPCARIPNGDIYFERGPDVRPLSRATNLWCPSDPDRTYAVAGADAARAPTAQDVRLRAQMQTFLDAAAKQGIRRIFFEDTLVSLPYYGGAADLYAQAAKAGLQPPAGGLLSNLSEADGLYVYVTGTGKVYPKACLTLPDPAQEIIAFKGTDKQTSIYADNLYCPTFTPPEYRAPLAG